jgi:nucleoside-diphosphate-sugar epimerase
MRIPAPLSFPAGLRDLVRAGGTRFVVTGAGGWLGRATLEMLDDALGEDMPHRVHAYAAGARPYRLRSGREIALSPLGDLGSLERGPQPTAIAHYAFLTREKAATMAGAAYVDANRWITRVMTEQAARLGAQATFSASSGAVYRRDGSLETSLAGNPYGALKREEEEAFARLARQTETQAVICRVFNLAGPFLNKDYALGSIIEDVLADRPIRIRAPHRVVRSYVHVRDVVTVGFAAMLGAVEAPPAPFDTAGEETVEVGELAGRARTALGRLDLAIERPPIGSGPDDRYAGNGDLFRRIAGQAGTGPASLDAAIRDTAAYLADIRPEQAPGGPARPPGVQA